MQFSQKIDGFRPKKITGLLELIQLYKTKPIREIFNFHHLPKLYIDNNNKIENEVFPHNKILKGPHECK